MTPLEILRLCGGPVTSRATSSHSRNTAQRCPFAQRVIGAQTVSSPTPFRTPPATSRLTVDIAAAATHGEVRSTASAHLRAPARVMGGVHFVVPGVR